MAFALPTIAPLTTLRYVRPLIMSNLMVLLIPFFSLPIIILMTLFSLKTKIYQTMPMIMFKIQMEVSHLEKVMMSLLPIWMMDDEGDFVCGCFI